MEKTWRQKYILSRCKLEHIKTEIQTDGQKTQHPPATLNVGKAMTKKFKNEWMDGINGFKEINNFVFVYLSFSAKTCLFSWNFLQPQHQM